MTTTSVPLVLDVQGQAIPLPPGARLMPNLLPMLVPSTMGGPVAQVAANPNDPSQLGLQNLTAQPWPARMPDGTERQVLPGQTLRLAEGVMLSWGGVFVQVRSAFAPAAPPPQPAFGEQPQAQAYGTPPLAQGGWQNPPPPGGWQTGGAGAVRPQQTPLAPPGGSLGMSQIMPLFSKTSRPKLKTVLIPGLILVVFVALLFATSGPTYIDCLGTLLLLMMFTVVYQLCGKKKPWWVFLLTALSTMILMAVFMMFGYFFNTPDNLIGFSIVGLREEFLKSIPVFVGLLIGLKATAPPAYGQPQKESWAERVGVREPLDGILIAAASASGFTFLETLGQYVPGVMQQVAQQSGAAAGEAAGVELLVPRILGDISGHLAYSGYFGYFIGLSALMPKHRVKLILIGFLASAGLHAFWDTFANNVPVMIVIGGLSFAFLAAAIVKARQLSPGRAMNFATQINRTP